MYEAYLLSPASSGAGGLKSRQQGANKNAIEVILRKLALKVRPSSVVRRVVRPTSESRRGKDT